MFLDTSIFIDFLRGDERAISLFESGTQFTTSVLVVMELIVGLPSKDKIPALERFLTSASIKVIAVDATISQRAYEIMKEQYHASHIGIADALIAATALSQQTPLMTHNTKHFRGVEGLEVLGEYEGDRSPN